MNIDKVAAELTARIQAIQNLEFHGWHGVVEDIQSRTRSPIEARLGLYLATDATLAAFGTPSTTFIPEGIVCNSKLRPPSGLHTVIVPQQKIGRFKVDFALIYPATDRRVVVECDGHAFHEKTAEQASRDKARDRELLSLGWPVMRFSGADIWHRGAACAAEVAEYLSFVDLSDDLLDDMGVAI